ncbi:hypothetical protein [Mesorhizobium sp. STM 4661]|nr:hypothetical protein [Mesorhizobium sp. STM 4661]
MPRTPISFEMRQKAQALKAEHFIGDPSRPLRGHPPLEGEADIGAKEE